MRCKFDLSVIVRQKVISWFRTLKKSQTTSFNWSFFLFFFTNYSYLMESMARWFDNILKKDPYHVSTVSNTAMTQQMISNTRKTVARSYRYDLCFFRKQNFKLHSDNTWREHILWWKKKNSHKFLNCTLR